MYRIRKFIILVAVMAISVVYAVTPVDFSNIVGYQVTTVTNGYSFKTPTFVDVGTNVLNIQNFRLSDRASGDSTETIQVLNADGALSGIYTWLNETVGMEPGWYDYWTWEHVSTDIPASLGYFMHANSKVKVKVIGELKLDSTTVELPIGYSVFGNNTPRDINLQDIRLGGDDACDKTENIQFLDNNGATSGFYEWNSNDKGEKGWSANDTDSFSDRIIKPGEAFFIYIGTGSQRQNADKKVTITFPSPLEKP